MTTPTHFQQQLTQLSGDSTLAPLIPQLTPPETLCAPIPANPTPGDACFKPLQARCVLIDFLF